MSNTENFTEEQKEVKRVITRKRVEIAEEIATVDNLGEETIAILPEDMSIMYAGKLCATLMKGQVAAKNQLAGYFRMYPHLVEETKLQMTKLQEDFESDFKISKERTEKIAASHPLVQKMIGIKGISGYQLALIMSYMKNPARFDTPSKLMIYAGIGEVNGMAVTKANIAKISEYYMKTYGREFKGFNTEFSGRMLGVVVDCLMRGKGFFYNNYVQMRKRLEINAINDRRTFVCTIEEAKESKGKMKAGVHYMKGRKNQSLIMWGDQNAKRRIARTFLHLLLTEWRTIAELPVRIPYPCEYLGHKRLITLDEVLLADSVKRVNKKKEKNNIED